MTTTYTAGPTLAALEETHGVTVDEHLDRQLRIPILTGIQRQGDVIVIPAHRKPATTKVADGGTPVVRGETGGNTHTVVGANIYCDTHVANAEDLTLATLTIPAGEIAYLAHPEHGYMGIGAGTYTLRRQREQADELRVVSD